MDILSMHNQGEKLIIFINGKEEVLDEAFSVLSLLEKKEINKDSVVVELNMEILNTEDYSKTILNENDRLEILQFVGGG